MLGSIAKLAVVRRKKLLGALVDTPGHSRNTNKQKKYRGKEN